MSLVRTTLLLLVLNFVSRALGVVREMMIAWQFGMSAETDAFFIAFSIPYAFYTVVGISLTAVTVPLLAEYEARDRYRDAMRIASLTINLVLLTVGVLAVLGMIGAHQVAWILGGGFSENTLKQVAHFVIWIMPSIVFMSIAGVLAGILNNRHVFGPPAYGQVAMNGVIILSAIFAGFWSDIDGLVIGTVTGALVLLLVHLPALRRVGYRHSWYFNLNDPSVKRIFEKLWPVMVVSSLGFLFALIDYRLASSLKEGSVTAINYATKLVQLPQGLFVIAVTTAIFPSLSKFAAENNPNEASVLLRKGLRIIILLALPGTVGLFITAKTLVQLLFQRGAFGADAATMTSSALTYLAIGLIGFCLTMPLIRGFYALNNERTPLMVCIASILVKCGLSLYLVHRMNYAGLALATSYAYLFTASLLALLLHRKIGSLFDWPFYWFFGNAFAATSVMAVCLALLENFIFPSTAVSMWGTLVGRLLLDIVVGTVVFIASGWVLRIEELRRLVRWLRAIVAMCRTV